MQTLFDNHVIFAIDNNSLHESYSFRKYLDQLKAISVLQYTPKLGIGYWEGSLEEVYMMHYTDFQKYVQNIKHINDRFIKLQDCFLVLNPRNSRLRGGYQGKLIYNNSEKESVLIGSWELVELEEAKKEPAWTFIDNSYFVCKTK